ncbi:MAG: serine--tRNA ligase [Candidatus Hodarchaeota archaeon]
MLDIELFRKNLDEIIESEKKRFKDPLKARRVLEYDEKWRAVLQELEDLRKKRNEISIKIGEFKKLKDAKSAEEAIKNSKEIKEKIDELEKLRLEYLEQRDKYRYMVGNILHESVPIGETEEDNEIVRTVGNIPKFDFKPLSHVDLILKIDGVDTKKASEIAGSRFYYLKGDLVLLNLALIKFALEKLISKNYIPMWTPFFTKHEVMKAAAELADFEKQLYKIQDEDLYMIATSEQTLAAYHYNEIIEPETLPLKYVGISSCFRREAGSHGKDTLGIFRVHRFEKVEQFIFCRPTDSWKYFEELIRNAEELYKDLEIPYRIGNVASGELNDNAAKKYDLEAWFPASKTYRELVSCSNCLDYQARKLKIRMGRVGAQEEKEVLHTLNSTAIATERTICCILENYQKKDYSITIPDVLREYMNDRKIIKAIK